MPSSEVKPIVERLIQVFAEEVPAPRRIFHGRGHFHPGLEHLALDWFPPLLLITAYEPLAEGDETVLLEAIEAADVRQQVQQVLLQHRFTTGAPAIP